MNPFINLIKFGVTFPKKSVKFPKEWQKITQSIYNNESNFAVLTGKINNIIVIDLDRDKNNKNNFIALEWFEENIGTLDTINTLVTKTINEGYHIFFKYPGNIIKNKINCGGKFIDILTDDKCVFQGDNYDILYNNNIRELQNNELQILINLYNKKKNNSNDEYDTILYILNNLKEERYNNYDYWRNIGFILNNITNGKELYKIFSQKSNKYNEKDFEDTWDLFKNSNYDGQKLSIATLYDYLKEDNLTKFKQINKKKSIDKKEIIENHFKDEFTEGTLEDIKYEKNLVKAKLVNNDTIDLKHIKHNSKICKGILFYNVEISSSIPNQITTNVNCNKCGFIHAGQTCMASNIYQLILNYQQEDVNTLKLIIPQEYQLKIHRNEKINELLYIALKQEDYTICEILYEILKDTHLVNNNFWYKYNGVIWEKLNSTCDVLFVINNIKEYVSNIYEKHYIENNLSTEHLKLLSKICDNLSKKLTKNGEDISYLNASIKFFIKPNLKFNEKKHLIAFQNGIYDLKNFLFRDGQPDDYISIQLDYIFQDIDTKKMNIVQQFLEDILPNTLVRDFLLKNIARCLLGEENIEQEFYILTGKKGANGKSVLTKLIENTFGEYFTAPEPTIITKPREKANEANEAMIDLDGKRIAIMSEPNKKDRILSDNLKKFTVGDTITARGNHKSSKKIQLNLKIFMLCNSIPLLDDCKDAEIRRLCIINFPNRFCENPKLKNEKLIDISLQKKLNECLNEFFHLLLSYLQTEGNISTKLIKPKEVTKQLDEYIEKNNEEYQDIYEYIYEYLEKDITSRIHCSTILTMYKSSGIKQIQNSIFLDLIEEIFDLETRSKIHINNEKRTGWIGIKLKESNY